MFLRAFGVCVILAATTIGCTRLSDYYPDSRVVLVEGEEFMVRPLARGNTWQAMVNQARDGDLLVIKPDRYRQNVIAIERATGCAVDVRTIQNRDNLTMAGVTC